MSFTEGQRVKMKSSPYSFPPVGAEGTVKAVDEQGLITFVIVDWDDSDVKPMYGHEVEAI